MFAFDNTASNEYAFLELFGVTSLARLMFTTDPDTKVRHVLNMLYPVAWLDSKAEGDPQGRTNRAIQSEVYLRRVAITKPQLFLGHISQMASGLTHHVSPERLRKISGSIPKVTIVTGDDDHLVKPANSRRLKEAMPEAELEEWEGTGHGIHHQYAKRFNRLLARTWEEGRKKLDEEPEKWGLA
jgi:pimeloyl-ACP methyl ester carboxylesterase